MLQSRFNYNYGLNKDFQSFQSASECLRHKKKKKKSFGEESRNDGYFLHRDKGATTSLGHQLQVPGL